MDKRSETPPDCIHGLAETWCAICREEVAVRTTTPRLKHCCAPKCRHDATKQVSSLPLCERHHYRLEKTIAHHTKSHKPSTSAAGWVYFVQIDDLIKIGFSRQPRTRLRSFGSYGHNVTVLGLEWGDRNLEKRLHRLFNDHQNTTVGLSRELFDPAPPILEYIRSGRQCAYCQRHASSDQVTCSTHAGEYDPEAEMIGRTIGHGE